MTTISTRNSKTGSKNSGKSRGSKFVRNSMEIVIPNEFKEL